MTKESKLFQTATQEENKFIEEGFGQVDYSGCPSVFLRKGADNDDEPFEDSDRHGFNRVDTSGLPSANKLKEFLGNPDGDSLARVASETGNLDLAEEVGERRREAEAVAFMKAHPKYYRCDENYDAIVEWLEARHLDFNRNNLAKAFRALTMAGTLETAPGELRNLTQHDALYVARQAASGDVTGAVINYVRFRLPGNALRELEQADNFDSAEAFLSNPDYRSLLDDGVFFVWAAATHEFDRTQDAEFSDWVARARTAKPLTIQFLNVLWKRFNAAKREAPKSLFHGLQIEPKVADIAASMEQSSDEEIERLLHATLKARARGEA